MAEISNEQIYELLMKIDARIDSMESHFKSRFDKIESEIAVIKQKVTTIEEHVGRIDERLTLTEAKIEKIDRIEKLFNPEVLNKVAK